MSRAALVLRPEPGNAATATRLETLGVATIRQPLFAVVPLPWMPPDPADFDALMLTSANAVHHAGPGLAALAGLPVLAVGEATAKAARSAGLTVALIGDRDAAALAAAARAHGFARLLHLTGRDHAAVAGATALPVYASEALPLQPDAVHAWSGQLALLHSFRAARRFAALVDRDGVARGSIAVAAISAPVRDAAGGGWESLHAATAPSDAALVALAARLIDPPGGSGDKRAR